MVKEIYLLVQLSWGKLVHSTLTSGADRMFVAPGQRATPLRHSGIAGLIVHKPVTSATSKAMRFF